MNGTLVLISGPSGVGKTTLVKRLLRRRGFVKSVSATTRPPRPGEIHGKNYFFLTPAQFRRTEFLESATIYGNRYGTPRAFVEKQLGAGRNVVLDVDVHCLRAVRRLRIPHVGVFVKPPSLAELRKRLVGRATETPAVVRRRFAKAKRELAWAREYDVVVVNDDLRRAERAIVAFLRKRLG